MRVIFIIGSQHDVTIRHLLRAVERMALRYHFVNLDLYLENGTLRASGGQTIIQFGSSEFMIGAETKVYARLFDMHLGCHADSIRQVRLAALVRALQVSPANVIPRPLAEGWNTSKPLHMLALKQAGFTIIPTLVTSSKEKALNFIERHDGKVIYKGVSSLKTIVRRWSPKDADRLDSAISCPVMLQREIEGPDIRVHMVGKGVFAEAIYSPEVDYRFSNRKTRRFNSHKIPDNLVDQIRGFASKHELNFTGADFKLDEAGRYYCLEINCNPAFEGYDFRAGGAIVDGLLNALNK